MGEKFVLETIRNTPLEITVIGETLQDKWIWGHYTRENPESRGNWIFVAEKIEEMPGGAASMRRSLDVLSGRPSFFRTRIGATKSRYALAEAEDVGKILFRVDADKVVQPFVTIGPPTRNVIISDYGKGFLGEQTTINELVEKLGRDSRVVYSPHIKTCRAMRADEGMAYLRENWTWVMNDAEANAAAENAVFPKRAIVTHGDRGAELRLGERTVNNFVAPALVPRPKHTSGAGDVFLAAYSAAHFVAWGDMEAVKFAVQCCNLVLSSGRLGTHYLTEEDLKKIGIDDA